MCAPCGHNNRYGEFETVVVSAPCSATTTFLLSHWLHLRLASPDVPETVTPVDSEKTQNWKKSLKNKNSGLLNIHKRRKKEKKKKKKKNLIFSKLGPYFFKIGPRSLRKSARKNIICFVFQVEKFPEVCANLRAGKIKLKLKKNPRKSARREKLCEKLK